MSQCGDLGASRFHQHGIGRSIHIDAWRPSIQSLRRLIQKGWRSAQDELLLNVTRRLLQHFHPETNVFVDAVHSMYAPYVDVFRADRYMAPHIRKQVERRGVLVVSRLEDIPAQIDELTQLRSQQYG